MMGYKGTTENTLVGMGKRIDEFCYKQNINYVVLAERIGCDKKTVYNILYNGSCRLGNLIKIANYFNCSLDYLVFGKERTR